MPRRLVPFRLDEDLIQWMDQQARAASTNRNAWLVGVLDAMRDPAPEPGPPTGADLPTPRPTRWDARDVPTVSISATLGPVDQDVFDKIIGCAHKNRRRMSWGTICEDCRSRVS